MHAQELVGCLMISHSTPVPNGLFDRHLKNLKASELKVLLVIIRQTLGWKNKRNTRDWISGSQFKSKTGLSKRSIGNAITSLQKRGLIRVTDYKNNVLSVPTQRQYSVRNYYALNTNLSVKTSQRVRKKQPVSTQNLRPTKETNTKENLQKIEKIKAELKARWGRPSQLSTKDIS